MTMPKILILNPSVKRLRTLEVAKEMGLEIVIADEKLNESFKAYAYRFIHINIANFEESLNTILRAYHEEPFDGVITFIDRGVELAAAISQATGIPGNSPNAAKSARNKHFMRMVLEKNNVPCPKFYHVYSLKDLKIASEELDFPFIFKPVGAASSKAIFKIESNSHLKLVYQEMLDATNPSNDLMFKLYPNEYIAEEYMVGQEFSVEGVSSFSEIHFAGITEKWTTKDNFTEFQHVFPARISKIIEDEIYQITKQALSAIDWKNGAFHVEVMLTHEGPKIIEINGRLGGDYITTHLVEAGRGMDIIQASYQAALGLSINLSAKFERGACVLFMRAEKEGYIKAWHGIDLIQKSENLLDLIIERNVGDSVFFPPTRYGEFRLAAAITQGDSVNEAMQWATKTIARLEVVIDDK